MVSNNQTLYVQFLQVHAATWGVVQEAELTSEQLMHGGVVVSTVTSQ